MSREQDSVAVLLAAAKRLRLGVEGPKIADELEAIATALQAQGADNFGHALGCRSAHPDHPYSPVLSCCLGDPRAADGAVEKIVEVSGVGPCRGHGEVTGPAGAAAVGDAVVERALRAFHGDGGNFHHFQWTADQRRSMRAALEAALATPSAPEAPCSTHPDAPHGVAGSNPAAQTISKEDHNVR